MSRELKVGAFVLVSVAIFMAIFVYVASVQVRGARIRYKITSICRGRIRAIREKSAITASPVAGSHKMSSAEITASL